MARVEIIVIMRRRQPAIKILQTELKQMTYYREMVRSIERVRLQMAVHNSHC